MFTLSALLLEDRENLFHDFGSLFSITFITFSASGFIFRKKSTNLPGRVRPGLQPSPASLKAEAPSRLTPSRRPAPASPSAAAALALPPPPRAPPPAPRVAAGAPPPPRRPAGGSRRRRRFSRQNRSVFSKP